MGQIISLVNHKGGVGKTTSVASIGAGLTRLNKNVLVVDLDPQANLTISLGIKNPKKTIYGNLKGEYEAEPYKLYKGFDIIPSDLDLGGAELELINETGREYFLKEILDSLKNKYDYILIDCPPSLGILTINALTASGSVLIPLQSQFLATHGVSKILEVIEKVKKRLNKKLYVGGVFITQYDKRKIINRDIAEGIESNFKKKLFKTKINGSVSLEEAPARREDIFTYDKDSRGAQDYMDLSKEILNKYEVKNG